MTFVYLTTIYNKIKLILLFIYRNILTHLIDFHPSQQNAQKHSLTTRRQSLASNIHLFYCFIELIPTNIVVCSPIHKITGIMFRAKLINVSITIYDQCCLVGSGIVHTDFPVQSIT